MPEEPIVADPIETPAAPVALADDKGVLRKGWLDSLDEDLRGELYLKEAKDVQSLAKGTVHARRMVGKDKMVKPTAESGDEVWEEYHRVGGRPDTALDYGFKKPDDMPDEHYSEEFSSAAMELFHKLGISKKAADAIFEFNNGAVMKALQAKTQADEFALDKLNNELDADWGLARDQKMHLGNIAIVEAVKDKNGVVNEEFKARLLEKVNKDPDLIRLVSNLGSKFAEHGVVHDAGIPTVGDLDAKIKEEMAKESYTKKKHPNHKNQVQLVAALFRDKTAAAKTG